MKSIKLKKFFLDYLVGSGLVFLLLIILIGKTTVLDVQSTIDLAHKCSLPFPEKDVLLNIDNILKDGESCDVVSPCDVRQSIQCEGTVEVFELPQTLFLFDSLTHRVTNTVGDSYRVHNYGNTGDLKISRNSVVLFLLYSMLLTESGAIIFALWRQKALRKLLYLPAGSRKDQFIKPVFFALMFATTIAALNIWFFALFDYPGYEQSAFINTIMTSFLGIVFAIFLAPALEELMFRGVFLRFFMDRNKLILGSVIVSLLFSVMHGFREQSLGWQIYMSSIYFVGSLLLCRLYITQKNLWSPIVFHGAYNSAMVIGFKIFS